MKYVGTYSDPKDIVTKDKLEAVASRVSTNEDNIAMAESDIDGLQTTVGTLKTNVGNIQTALTNKQDVIVGAASTITENNLVADRALISNSSGKVAVSNVTSTELGYLDGVTSNVQTQLNKKLEKAPVTSVNNKTGAVQLNASDVGALPDTTVIPSKTSQLTNDSGFITDKELADKVSKSGDTMTGKLTVPQVETGDGNSNFFQCRKFRGEGNADTYYHAIDFGYRNHDRVDFHEYGGLWSFYKNQTGKVNDGVLCGKITSNGWEGRAKLESGSTMVTSQLTENSNAIATTAFVHGLVDGLKPKRVSVTLPASGWNSSAKTQTVSVAGVTATANCIITAAPDSYMAYAEAGVRCTAQGAGTLTFACETMPTADVAANVLIVG